MARRVSAHGRRDVGMGGMDRCRAVCTGVLPFVHGLPGWPGCARRHRRGVVSDRDGSSHPRAVAVAARRRGDRNAAVAAHAARAGRRGVAGGLGIPDCCAGVHSRPGLQARRVGGAWAPPHIPIGAPKGTPYVRSIGAPKGTPCVRSIGAPEGTPYVRARGAVCGAGDQHGAVADVLLRDLRHASIRARRMAAATVNPSRGSRAG